MVLWAVIRILLYAIFQFYRPHTLQNFNLQNINKNGELMFY